MLYLQTAVFKSLDMFSTPYCVFIFMLYVWFVFTCINVVCANLWTEYQSGFSMDGKAVLLGFAASLNLSAVKCEPSVLIHIYDLITQFNTFVDE